MRLPNLNLPAVAPSASNKRLFVYLVVAAGSYVMGITTPPHGWWEAVKFFVGLAVALATTYRAFIDLVQGRQEPPPDQTAGQANAPVVPAPVQVSQLGGNA